MKAFFVFITLAVVVLSANGAPPADAPCAAACTLIFSPVCGYDGTCYKIYPNKCAFDFDQCTRRKEGDLTELELFNCDSAAENYKNYEKCA